MDYFEELRDDLEHMNAYGRDLIRDLVRDFRQLYPEERAKPRLSLVPSRPVHVGTLHQPLDHSVQRSLAISVAQPVSHK